jgi:hypothetical protein
MVPTLFFSLLGLVALVWFFLMLYAELHHFFSGSAPAA